MGIWTKLVSFMTSIGVFRKQLHNGLGCMLHCCRRAQAGGLTLLHVLGRFPIRGDTLSDTSGLVSRIQLTTYTQSTSDLLGVQIDAAINAGNSGGPSFNNKGECVGVAFQSMRVTDIHAHAHLATTHCRVLHVTQSRSVTGSRCLTC